jgi:hypothetical protein
MRGGGSSQAAPVPPQKAILAAFSVLYSLSYRERVEGAEREEEAPREQAARSALPFRTVSRRPRLCS